MADLLPITFKATQEFSDWMCVQSGELVLSRSEFIRQSLRVAAHLLRAYPALLTADDKRIADVMNKVGKILVILEDI